MKACEPSDLSAEGVWYAPLLPLKETLGGHVELSADDRGHLLDQLAVIVGRGSHTPVYQRSVYKSSPQSLMAAETWLMHNARMPLSRRITAAYEALGLTQAEVARRCGWSAQRFGQYANGKRTPDLPSLVKIAEALNTTPDHLLGVSEQQPAELTDILGKLLELEGLDPQTARTIAEAASATQQVLKSLPGNGDDQERARLAAQAVWSARRIPTPDKALAR